MTLLEPDVALTDFGLALECAFLAGWLRWRAAADQPLRTWYAVFFAAVGVAALLGGIAHGFLADTQSTLYGVLWSATLLAIGIAALACWGIGARLILSVDAAKRVLIFAAASFGIYLAAILGLSRSFAAAIAYYAPAALFLLCAFVVAYRRRRSTHLAAGIAGVTLSLAAAAIQQTQMGIPSLGLTHNALYHLIQGVALALIFLAACAPPRDLACTDAASR